MERDYKVPRDLNLLIEFMFYAQAHGYAEVIYIVSGVLRPMYHCAGSLEDVNWNVALCVMGTLL